MLESAGTYYGWYQRIQENIISSEIGNGSHVQRKQEAGKVFIEC